MFQLLLTKTVWRRDKKSGKFGARWLADIEVSGWGIWMDIDSHCTALKWYIACRIRVESGLVVRTAVITKLQLLLLCVASLLSCQTLSTERERHLKKTWQKIKQKSRVCSSQIAFLTTKATFTLLSSTLYNSSIHLLPYLHFLLYCFYVIINRTEQQNTKIQVELANQKRVVTPPLRNENNLSYSVCSILFCSVLFSCLVFCHCCCCCPSVSSRPVKYSSQQLIFFTNHTITSLSHSLLHVHHNSV